MQIEKVSIWGKLALHYLKFNHAKVRGFNLPQDVAKYLISRVPRDVSVLVDIIKLLDYESLSKQRKLTIPFIKTVLDIK